MLEFEVVEEGFEGFVVQGSWCIRVFDTLFLCGFRAKNVPRVLMGFLVCRDVGRDYQSDSEMGVSENRGP